MLTERDQSIITTLTHHVKILSLDQIIEGWWPAHTSRAVVIRRLRVLEHWRWIRILHGFADLVIEIKHPLAVWHAGEESPNFDRVVSNVRKRSESRRPIWQLVVSGTERSSHEFGGRARLPRPSECSHDLCLSAVYLHFRMTRPLDADAWHGEAARLPHIWPDDVVPDAIVQRDGRTTAIEFVGESYRPSKLEKFHMLCQASNWSYELW